MRRAFQQQGPSIQIAVTTVAGTVAFSTLTTAGTNSGIESIRVYNQSTNDVLVWTGNSTATATSATTAAGFNGMFVPHGQVDYFSVGPNGFISALTTAAALTALVTVTPGSGGI
jgi:hypothetical protein